MSDIAEIRRRLAEETQEVPCASCLGTRKGEGECCEDCDGLGTDEVLLIKGLQHYLDCIEVVENDPVVGAAQYYLYAYTAAFTVACLEWLIQQPAGDVTLSSMLNGNRVVDSMLYDKPVEAATLHEAVVRATWQVVQEIKHDIPRLS